MVLSFTIAAVLGLVGGLVRVPYVSIGPGPTYDTLGRVNDQAVVQVDGEETYETSGQLRMTTVSVSDDISLFGALGLWVSGRYALQPRDVYFGPGQTEEELEQENTKMFQNSQSAAEVAALRYLDYPVQVVAQEITRGAPVDGVLEPGDQLLSVNGSQIAVQEDVSEALRDTKPGDQVAITFQRGDEPPRTSTIELGNASDFGAGERSEGFLGLAPVDRADVEFETTIHLEDVGGPSAGLIFALAIVDKLTPGQLEDGRTVAGTGEIDVKGNVGPIGGISFKLVAASEAGADTFLVPASNCAEAKADAPDGLRLVKVDTLASAVEALEDLEAGRTPPSC
ncbi:PDZ domain-containing protein [Actinophytocola sp. S1-96]|uniref:endopeptidase La n=1 Tax=Actinophytocola gossypii TaxID=2812003 RepID=A0ABT2JKC6_9PSEU|nr:PDZ domain-containing protein [Actinophytocola gossypii]